MFLQALSGAGGGREFSDERSRPGNTMPMGRGASNRVNTPSGSMEKERSVFISCHDSMMSILQVEVELMVHKMN